MERKETNRRDARSELESALAQRFYAILRVDPARNTVLILQSRDFPQSVDTEMDWDDYLERYSRILTSSGRERLFGEFSARALLRRGEGGEGHFSLDLPYLKGAATNWVTVWSRWRRSWRWVRTASSADFTASIRLCRADKCNADSWALCLASASFRLVENK